MNPSVSIQATQLTEKDNQVFVLNMLSNLTSNYAATSEEELKGKFAMIQDALNDKVIKPAVGGEWKVLWQGVKVSMQKWGLVTRYFSDNSMYLAERVSGEPGRKELFIGIAGTNGISRNGWFVQDFMVGKMVSWPSYPGGEKGSLKGHISEGGAIGLNQLLEIKDESRQTLIEVLETRVQELSAAGNKVSISVAGHSLGGNLSTIMALAVHEMLTAAEVGNFEVTCYPTGGPTSGDQEFLDYLASQIRYRFLYNLDDVVPITWDFADLDDLVERYATYPVPDVTIDTNQDLIKNSLTSAQSFTQSNAYARIPSEIQAPSGIFTWVNGGAARSLTDSNVRWQVRGLAFVFGRLPFRIQLKRLTLSGLNREKLLNFARFFVEMGAQHVGVYGRSKTAHEIGFEVSPDVLKVVGKWVDKEHPGAGGIVKKELTKNWKRVQFGILLLHFVTKLANAHSEKRGEDQVNLPGEEENLESLEKALLTDGFEHSQEELEHLRSVDAQKIEEVLAALPASFSADLLNPFTFTH